jgi:hypothetical protein
MDTRRNRKHDRNASHTNVVGTIYIGDQTMEINDNAEKLLEFCEVIDLDEESAAKAMAIACATLAGNESNLLNLVSMMIQAFQIINE